MRLGRRESNRQRLGAAQTAIEAAYIGPEDASFALNWVKENAKTRVEQDAAISALRAKCDILWAQLDALYFAYVEPGWPPPGAYRPEVD